jgi:hypothetical protein
MLQSPVHTAQPSDQKDLFTILKGGFPYSDVNDFRRNQRLESMERHGKQVITVQSNNGDVPFYETDQEYQTTIGCTVLIS